MMEYRTKAIVVEAQQWFPPGDERHDPEMLSHRKGNTVSPPDYRQAGDIYCFAEGAPPGYGGNIYFIRVGGPNDNIKLEPGDWIIRLPSGAYRTCNTDDFGKMYEAF